MPTHPRLRALHPALCRTPVALVSAAALLAACTSGARAAPTTTTAPGVGAAARGSEASARPAPFTQLALGGLHSCALAADGRVFCWGSNEFGQLGDGTVTDRAEPVPVANLAEVVEVSVGRYHSCARLRDGVVSCWGNNQAGQLGDSSQRDRHEPAVVRDVTGATRLAVGAFHGCAIVRDGAVRCWGNNDSAQLGDGSAQDRWAAVGIPGLRDVAEIAAGGGHSCALTAGGAVLCWGDNTYGQTGHEPAGAGFVLHRPEAVAALPPARHIAAGGTRTCALLRDGAVRCWGAALLAGPDDPAPPARPAPAPIALPRGAGEVEQLAMGEYHECARLAGGAVYCWGQNHYGAVGDGTLVDREAPTLVAGLEPATQVAVGGFHSCVLVAGDAGAAACWGAGEDGRLGNGERRDRVAPVSVVRRR